ncbi:MAG TPA: 50S ribosomal protein L18 [Chryseolinea sp.]
MAGKNNERRERIKLSVRNKISGTKDRPRLSVFRSNKGLFVQVIDDENGKTIASASTIELGEKAKLNQENSKNVGKKIAEKALASGVNTIVFDRNGYLYHGNIKALAEGAREGGLKF